MNNHCGKSNEIQIDRESHKCKDKETDRQKERKKDRKKKWLLDERNIKKKEARQFKGYQFKKLIERQPRRHTKNRLWKDDKQINRRNAEIHKNKEHSANGQSAQWES